MEGNAFTQLEGVDGAVLADLPRFGKGGFYIERTVLKPHQPVVDVHQNAKVVDRRDRMRIERLGFGDLTDNKGVFIGPFTLPRAEGKSGSDRQDESRK